MYIKMISLNGLKPFKYLSKQIRPISSLNLWNEPLSSEIKHKIEKHWKDAIKQEPYKENDPKREKYYVLSMFPYPSGFLHMGHVRVYTISDTIARYQRMNNKNVIHPIGWDAFGLPAENAAIDRKIPPDEWTNHNISHMKKQLQQLGCSFDWNRELATCNPEYYRWTQELFLKLFNADLVYQKEALVNWDPIDQTVLADEQVDENNCSWRSGAKVEKRLLKQWFVRTTKYAKDLLDGLQDSILQDWRDIIKLQRHWIGECDGVSFDFKISEADTFLTVWTNLPEYIKNVKFLAVTQDHILAKKENVVLDNIRNKKLKAELKNPFNNEMIPIYVTDEIEFQPFTDSYLGIPGIVEEATSFAKNHNISFENPKMLNKEQLEKQREDIIKQAEILGVGGYWTSAKLRDWLISRQRYWGTPIPIIHCDNCGTVPVPRENLPVILPKLRKLSEKGVSQLSQMEWVNVNCPKCNAKAKRETDTMDTFVDSSWYFLRYIDPHNTNEMFSSIKAKEMTPVDLYIGGKEHAVLHLYYARFISHFLHSLGLLPEREPFKRLLVQGMVMGRSFRKKGTGEYLPENKVKIVNLKKNKAVVEETGEPVVIAWEKMSKSKHNGVDPNDMFEQYGIDTTRLLILGDVSPTSHRNWNSSTFPGIINWQNRLWLTIKDFIRHRSNLPSDVSPEVFQAQEDYLFDSRNFYIKGATFNYLISQQLSVALSKQQGLTNSIRKAPPAVFAKSLQFERALATQIILLAPMAPHFASELWSGFVSAPNRLTQDEWDWDKSVLEQKWPEVDMDYKLNLECHINGVDMEEVVIKLPRRELDTLSRDKALELIMKQEAVQSLIKRRKVIDFVWTLHKGCVGIVNIIVEKPLHSKISSKTELQN